ncbi:unnamed protein product [Auanema sp. JU1783]|nr:unnamed protein product [Auanema sp. JU1783]
MLFVDNFLQRLLSPSNRLLHLSFICFIVPYLYSQFNDEQRRSTFSVEQAMFNAWDKTITKPSSSFSKAVVGFNANVDLIVMGTNLIESLNTTCNEPSDHESLSSLNDLHETFAYFFQRGAAAERYLSSEESFNSLVRMAEHNRRAQFHIGGNAALMAERIAITFPSTEVILVGPIGPRSHALLHPSVQRTNSTKIVKDELHIIMEYRQGEILGDWVAPSSSRFITSRDQFSGSSVVIDMFFSAISQFKPDLVIITGVHLLEFQEKDSRAEKMTIIRRNLKQINFKIPIHLELGSLGDAAFLSDVLFKVIPYVDSLGINEQELAFLSHVAGGPHMDAYPVQAGSVHAHKVVEMLHWLLHTFGRVKTNPKSISEGYRLQRIHFHCLTYHIMVSIGTDWSNLAAGLSAGARLVGRLSCNLNSENALDSDLLEVRTPQAFPLDKQIGKMYHFQPHSPVASWIRDDVLFVFTPVLVCKFPSKTVGIDDAVSAVGLLYSQFYRFEKW